MKNSPRPADLIIQKSRMYTKYVFVDFIYSFQRKWYNKYVITYLQLVKWDVICLCICIDFTILELYLVDNFRIKFDTEGNWLNNLIFFSVPTEQSPKKIS